LAADYELLTKMLGEFYDFAGKVVLLVGAGHGQLLDPSSEIRKLIAVDKDRAALEEFEKKIAVDGRQSSVEVIHGEFAAKVPHPELHGGKKPKNVWAQLEDAGIGFLEFVERHALEHEEGNLFSYLVRVMNFARKLYEASQLTEFEDMAERVQKVLARVDIRLIDDRKW